VQTKAFAPILVACVALIVPIRAWAGPVEVYTLEGVSYSNSGEGYASGTLSGSFDYDGTSFTNIDITATGGIVDGDVFIGLNAGSNSSFLSAEAPDVDYINLNFVTPLSSSGGTDAITGGLVFSESYYNSNFPNCTGAQVQCTETIADAGYVTDVSSTPIPAVLPLFATGLGGLGLFGRGRKRNKTAALAI